MAEVLLVRPFFDKNDISIHKNTTNEPDKSLKQVDKYNSYYYRLFYKGYR